MDLQLHDKSALVTGSSKGIGEAIAYALAREGMRVVVHGREPARVQDVVAAIAASGGAAVGLMGDLTVDADVDRLVAAAEDQLGRIDILVNNAGGSGPKNDWQSTGPAYWTASYDRNVLAALRVTTRLLPAMRTSRWGRVINISSSAATMPPAAGPDYSAAKAAMNAMTASTANRPLLRLDS